MDIKKNNNNLTEEIKYSNKVFFCNKKYSKPLQKLKADIDKNSRVFFGTLRKIDNNEIINDNLSKASNNANPKKSTKKKIFNICFFIFNVLLVVFVFYNFAKEQGGVQPLSTLFANHPKWRYLFIALGLYILTVIFNSLKFIVLIKNKTSKFRLWFSFKIASIGKYYDNVTPLGSGGQPFEIYYLKKNGYSGDTSTAIPLAKYMAWQVSFVMLCLVILIAYSKNYVNSPFVLVCAWIGLIIVLSLFLFVFLMSITKKWGASLVVGVLKLLHKMKIIKDYKKALSKVLKFVKQYQYSIKSFAKSPFTVITEIIVTLGSIISNALIAYFIYIAFVQIPVVAWWDIVCKCCICELAVCFFPLPGGSGMQEISFKSLLGALFPEGTIFWGILIWRILTYYIHILQGGIVIIGDFIAKKVKERKHLNSSTNHSNSIDKKIINNKNPESL